MIWGSIPRGEEQRLYGDVQPPPAEQSPVPESQGPAVANVPQRRPTQDDRQDHRSHAGYGRGYVDAGPADPFQAETYDGF